MPNGRGPDSELRTSWLKRIATAQKQAKQTIPNIGVVFSATSTDPNENREMPGLSENLGPTPQHPLRCNKVLLDYREKGMVEEFFTAPLKNPDGNEVATLKHGPDVADNLYNHVKAVVEEARLDGIIFPGNWYNMIEPGVNPSKYRREYQTALLRVADEKGIPLLGLCGGEQFIAYMAGAELTNQAAVVAGYNHFHKPADPKVHPAREIVHDIVVKPHTTLDGAARVGKPFDSAKPRTVRMGVNSTHNQGVVICQKTLEALDRANLEVVALEVPFKEKEEALAPNRKGHVAEALENKHGTLRLLVQFHAEYLLKDEREGYRPDAMQRYMQAFLDAASTYAAKREVNEQIKESIEKGTDGWVVVTPETATQGTEKKTPITGYRPGAWVLVARPDEGKPGQTTPEEKKVGSDSQSTATHPAPKGHHSSAEVERRTSRSPSPALRE